MANVRVPRSLTVLVGIDISMGAGLLAIALAQFALAQLGIAPPFAEEHVLRGLALSLIVVGVALYRRVVPRAVGLACGWVAIGFGLLMTGAVIWLSAVGVDLNRVIDAKSGSMALFDIGVAERWWAFGYACFLFLIGVIHLWVLSRADVRDFFRRSPG